jgi:nicotinate phosphoribosyltransferase
MAAGYLDALYRGKLALLTDLYQLTMAHGYWLEGLADRPAVFHLFFRRPPFGGGYAIAAGLGPALDYLEDLAFDDDDLAYLRTLRGGDDKPLFDPRFVDALRAFRFTCSVDAVPEGRAVFPHEPLIRVEGPMLAAQLVETPLLTMINYQTLVATKAARVCQAAGDAPVLEFGLRRAQGPDGGVGAARAAWIGGCAATSNVLAGRLLGMPVRGTHAHSWVMAHADELSAFRAYAAAMPNNCTFLVDTYDTEAGVAHAITVGRELRAAGHDLVGIRLDSGDLAHLSASARRALDDAGFASAKIVASNDLDENLVASLREQGARIDVWGVGTKLVTGHDQPALGGVYKLGAIRDPATGAWRDTLKVSEQPIKVSNPGVLGVRRFLAGGQLVGDVIYDVERGLTSPPRLGDMDDLGRATPVPAHDTDEDMLVRVMDRGKVVVRDTIEAARARCRADLAALSPRTRRFLNPQPYPVGLDPHVQRRKRDLIDNALGRSGDHP